MIHTIPILTRAPISSNEQMVYDTGEDLKAS
jgi:hypothetical protein